MLFDIRLALRSFARSRAFTATAVLTLTIGIGGSTAIFSLVDAVLLRPLPYPDAQRLVRIWGARRAERRDRAGVSSADALDWQDRSRTVDGIALFGGDRVLAVLGTASGSVQIRDVDVSPNFFAVLGAPPLVGRGFALEPDQGRSALREVVLSEGLWRSVYGGDPAIVGRSIRLEGRDSWVVVGVIQAHYAFPAGTEMWISAPRGILRELRRDDRFWGAVARLPPRTDPGTVRAEFETIAAQLMREHPTTNADWTVTLAPLQEAMVGDYRLALVTLLAAVGLVLLVGCVNVANLLLARGVSRRRELAVRSALGASRMRLVRQLLTEAAMLAIAGGLAGCLLAGAAIPVVVRLTADAVPRMADATLSVTALAFCAAASIAAALLVGLVPAFRAARDDVQAAIQADGERGSASPHESRLQRLLVAGEVALSLMLVTGAVLLIQSFVRLRLVDVGFNPSHVVSIDARVPMLQPSGRSEMRSRYPLLAETRALVAALRAVPGVQSAATTSDAPLGGKPIAWEVTLGPGDRRMAAYHSVSEGYFTTIGIPLRAGRDFTDRDALEQAQIENPGASRRDGAAIVNETAARAFWPGRDAIGQYISTSLDSAVGRRRIVGIVGDAHTDSVRTPPSAEVYVPYAEDPSFAMTILVRARLPLDGIWPSLRAALLAVDRELSVANVRSADDIVAGSVGFMRASTLIVAAFAAVTLLLASVGVYGVVAFRVTRRTREVGIRIALGAGRGDIRRLLLGEATIAVGVGAAAGVAGSLALTRLIASLLFGVTAADPASFAISVMVLVAVTLAAGAIPVRAAIGIDPAEALRY